jgi:hypothetical protein
MVAYIPPIVYVFQRKNEPTILNRSPRLIIICFFMLLCNSILNTIVFATNTVEHPLQNCKIGMINDSFFFIGFIVFYFLRMYRMFRFFSIYEFCLQEKFKAH